MMIPSFRTNMAIERGVEKKLLFKTWGGLGDQICTEPTMRFAFSAFKGCEIYLASEAPELFSHLPFKEVFNLKKVQPIWEDYLVFNTITDPSHLNWEFFSHCVINCVDYPSISCFRSQLPIKDREIKICPPEPPAEKKEFLEKLSNRIVIHPGRHWPSKTFPKDWWDRVLFELVDKGYGPVLIGADTDDNRGTVDVETAGCIDLRNKLTTIESIWYLQRCKVLLTNDSSPLHMAASGDAWIGYIATCKHFDYITHYRHGQFQWREVNHGRGGIWENLDHCPNKKQEVKVDQVEESVLRSWLPEPAEYANWAIEKLLSKS